MPDPINVPFHGILDHLLKADVSRPVSSEQSFPMRHRYREITYHLQLHAHPLVRDLLSRINQSVDKLEGADTEYQRTADGRIKEQEGRPLPTLYSDFFQQQYAAPTARPKNSDEGASVAFIDDNYPVYDLDFSTTGAYAAYNWELFYHLPLMVAMHLSSSQRYEEAERWFRYIFDPTDDSADPTPERFWKVKPFRELKAHQVEDELLNLASGNDPALKVATIKAIEKINSHPFRPHVVARTRPTAYMLKALMAWFDHKIAWGDYYFRQDTSESVPEAFQHYAQVALVLGTRPQPVPKDTRRPAKSYHQLRPLLDKFGNALVDIENRVTADDMPFPRVTKEPSQQSGLKSVGQTLYFCIPPNQRLLSYWDTITDRLFKIRNSLNFRGIFRQLPLFDPPIDPALLARAVADGISIENIVNGLNQPLPLVRCQVLLQKAAEICAEVKSLGSQLLAAVEREDNEALAVLRARHETRILGLAEMVKYAQYQESIKAREGLEKTRENALLRFVYYQTLLGVAHEDARAKVQDLDGLNREQLLALARLSFDTQEPEVPQDQINVQVVDASHKLNREESSQEESLRESHDATRRSADSSQAGAGLAIIPDFVASTQPYGLGTQLFVGGGRMLVSIAQCMAGFYRANAEETAYGASQAGRMAGYIRRENDWRFQSNQAAGEITQINKQLRAAQIREALANREWENHKRQMEQAKAIEEFFTSERNGKKTNQAFCAWLTREVRGLYSQCYQFALEVAKKAERALQHELGMAETFIRSDYQTGKEGLLAGERLQFDLKRMELAYLEQNRREYELSKHVSMLQVDPEALIQLRSTGRCTVSLPEELFDFDSPGHYFRRIKTVAVSIPCVVGPYASVNCTLTLLKSQIRKVATLRDKAYSRQLEEDSRFDDYFGSSQSIVASSAQNDSGMFETNLRDERYLPFEGAGAVSEWQLELPGALQQGQTDTSKTIRQFDYDTIADVILHVRYTAREGGEPLRKAATANLLDKLGKGQATGSVRLFSVRHEFPTAWAAFRRPPAPGEANPRAALTLELRPEHYPFWAQGRLNGLREIQVFAATDNEPTVFVSASDTAAGVRLSRSTELPGYCTGSLLKEQLPQTPTSPLRLIIDSNDIAELLISVKWRS